MTTKVTIERIPSCFEESTVGEPANSRNKMISLLVKALLLQVPSNSSQNLLLSEVFGSEGKLLISVRQLVLSYLLDDAEIASISHYINMPRFIDLTDPNSFEKYIEAEFRTKNNIVSFVSICKRIYQSRPLAISENYGLQFPMNPEVLAYAMRLANNEVVLEIAGATGENSIVLAFSGAKRVYVNDICQKEMEDFEKLRKMIPQDVNQKLESIYGDCFELLKLKPELEKKVGLVLCRSLLHFFNNQQQTKFFAQLKKILKPKGRAIFTVNSIYVNPASRTLYKSNPDATSFSFIQGAICTPAQLICFYQKMIPCSDDQISNEFVDHYLYKREKGGKWEVDNEEFNKLDKKLRPEIQKAFLEFKEDLKKIPVGVVKVIITTIRAYSPKTFSELFLRHGFQIEATFVTANNGHLVHAEDLFALTEDVTGLVENKPLFIGAIVRYTGTDSTNQ